MQHIVCAIAALAFAAPVLCGQGDDAPEDLSPRTVARLERALDHLAQLALARASVHQSVEGFRIEGGPPGDEIASNHPYRPLVELAREQRTDASLMNQTAAWDAGRICGIAKGDVLSGTAFESRPFVGFYWAANRGLRLEFSTALVQVIDRFRGFRVEFWPHELRGYYGATPLAGMAQFAHVRGELEIVDEGTDQITVRFPCNPAFDPLFVDNTPAAELPLLELDFRLGSDVRLVRQTYWTEERGVFDSFTATEWLSDEEGRAVPVRFDYSIHLGSFPVDGREEETRRIVFRVAHVPATEHPIDGRTMLQLVDAVGFFDTGESVLATSRGCDRIVEEGFERLEHLAPELPLDGALGSAIYASLDEELERGHARIREHGPEWPSLSTETIESEIVDRMERVDVKYCSQLSATVLRRIHGDAVAFASVLDRHPGDKLSMRGVVECLADGDLDYVVVRTDDVAGLTEDEPFLMLLGEDPDAGHLAVARRMDDGSFRIWAPPNTLKVAEPAALGHMNPLGVYVVPSAWIAEESLRAWARLGLFALLGATAFLLFKHRRSRAAVSACALLCLATLHGCHPSHASPDDGAKLIASSEEAYEAEVPMGNSRHLDVEIHNLTDERVQLREGKSDCSCVRYVGRNSYEIAPGGSVHVPLQILGVSRQLQRRCVRFVAESGDRRQLLEVPIEIRTVNPLYLDPPTLQWTGRSGEALQDGFDLCVFLPDGERAEVPTWSSDVEGLRLEIVGREVERVHEGLLHRFKFRCTLPEGEPGSYVARLTFALAHRRQADGEPQLKRLEQLVPVQLGG